MLVELLPDFGERLVELLPPLVELGEVVDLELVVLGHLHVTPVYLLHDI